MEKFIPLIVIRDLSDTESVLKGLRERGMNTAEITFRTDCAEEAIRLGCKLFPDMDIGAGTVINGGQCERALAAGAKFIVSPGLSEEVAKVCREKEIPYLPGIVTPTEIMQALSLNLTYLKFFPAGSFGGLNTIKALSAAFPQVRFMPTGGVNFANMNEYLSFPKIFACGGSWMMQGSREEIAEQTRAAVLAAKGEEK